VIREFRDFILRGNVVDLAVAVIIGGAFALLINSFVVDILTPLLGLLGVQDFSQLTWETPGGAILAYGNFLNAVIAFLLVAAAIFFFVVKPMNAIAARRAGQEPEEAPTTKACSFCATDIPIAATRCPNCTSQLT
jgi:large conductance mechanosensitive channel